MEVTVNRQAFEPRVQVTLDLGYWEARRLGRLAHSSWLNLDGFAWKIADAIELEGIDLEPMEYVEVS